MFVVQIHKFPDKPTRNTDMYRVKLAAAKVWFDLKEKYDCNLVELTRKQELHRRQFASTIEQLERG